MLNTVEIFFIQDFFLMDLRTYVGQAVQVKGYAIRKVLNVNATYHMLHIQFSRYWRLVIFTRK